MIISLFTGFACFLRQHSSIFPLHGWFLCVEDGIIRAERQMATGIAITGMNFLLMALVSFLDEGTSPNVTEFKKLPVTSYRQLVTGNKYICPQNQDHHE